MHFRKLLAVVFELMPYSQSMPPPNAIFWSRIATPSSCRSSPNLFCLTAANMRPSEAGPAPITNVSTVVVFCAIDPPSTRLPLDPRFVGYYLRVAAADADIGFSTASLSVLERMTLLLRFGRTVALRLPPGTAYVFGVSITVAWIAAWPGAYSWPVLDAFCEVTACP